MTSPSKRHSGSLHLCNWPGCRRPVPFDMWGCRSHWFHLPPAIQEGITKGWRFGRGRNSPEWRKAHQAALDWIAKIPEEAAASRIATPIPGDKPC